MGEPKHAWVRGLADQSAQRLAFRPRGGGPGRTGDGHCHLPLPTGGGKALKGYLAYHDQPLERTHDLERLLELAAALDCAFAALEVPAEALNPYGTAFRYPDALNAPFPSVAEVNTAIQHAQAIYDFVLRRLPTEVHPN